MKAGGVKLQNLKQELAERDTRHLAELCLQLAKFKSENKELLTYLLFYAHDPIAYTSSYKEMIVEPFDKFIYNPYHLSKGIRKSFRLISRYAKITKSKEGECELYLHLILQFVERIPGKIVHKSLVILLERAFKKAALLILKMHEDFQLDYLPQFKELRDKAATKTTFSDFDFGINHI